MSEAKTTHFDGGWGEIDGTAEPEFFIRFLDASRARMLETVRRNPSAALAHLELRPGLSVLDAGCGVGDLTTIFAGLVSPGGRAVGIDLSEAMLAEARRRVEGSDPRPLFEQGNAQQLRFGAEEFDRTLATQLLVHVPDPARALDELCRVTRSGGLVVLGEMDWDTLVLALDDRSLARRFTHLFSDGIRNPLIVRELPGMLRGRGMADVKLLPQPMVFDSYEFVRQWIVEPALTHAAKTALFLPAEMAQIESELASRAADGRFFAASTFYTVIARR